MLLTKIKERNIKIINKINPKNIKMIKLMMTKIINKFVMRKIFHILFLFIIKMK